MTYRLAALIAALYAYAATVKALISALRAGKAAVCVRFRTCPSRSRGPIGSIRRVPRPDRLSALDAAFLDLETPAAPLHVGWTLRLEGDAPALPALRRHIDAHLDALPRFRRRVVRPALGLGDPYWADDASFDIARHVQALTLAPPAGPRELRELVGALLSRPLDPLRPLWRMVLIDGLAGGGSALAGQVHHALVDGIAAVEVGMLLFDRPASAMPGRWAPQPAPSPVAAAGAAARDRLDGVLRGARAAARSLAHADAASVRAGAGLVRDARDALGALSGPAPATALNHTAGPERLVAFAEASFEGVREAGRRHDATVNDVLLAASAMALGRALRRRGEHHGVIKALVPVNLRGAADAGALGNRVSFLTADLPVDETDPVVVLRRVRAQTRVRKAAGHAAPLDALAQAAELLPATARKAVAHAAVRMTAFNAAVSNVPGPPVTLTLLGRPVAAIFPAVPILDGHALAIGAISYRERLQVGLFADARIVPDAVDVAREIEQAFDALRIAPRPEPPPWRTRARTRRDAQREAAASR
jgi:diacylglycerol O-acyltransferase / wax synthase